MKPGIPGTAKLKSALKPARTAIIVIVVFSLFVNILMMVGPLFMLQIYDRVLTSGSIPTLVALVVLVAILYGLFGFLDYVRGRILTRVASVLEEDLQQKVFHTITFHALQRTPGVRTQPAQDLATVRQFLSSPAPFSFLDLPWTPVYLFVIFLLHFMLGIAATIAVIILGILAVINNLLTRNLIAEHQQATQQAINSNEETRRNVEIASVLGMLGKLRMRWMTTRTQALDAQIIASDRGGLVSTVSKTMRLMFQSGILALGAYLAVKQEISPGTMIAASIIMSRALAPVEQVVGQWQPFVTFRKSWARLNEVLEKTPPPPEQMVLPEPKVHLQAKNLMAFVPGAEKPIISGINFDLPPGSGLGIIGPTGAGKSTLARVIIGVWPHTKGDLRFDGATLDQWDREELGKYVGYLPQDVELFDGTIGENISRFDPQADPKVILAAAQAANVHELVLQFPGGYNTRVGEGGASLSGGQRQRIGLARALYGNPVLVVLDEPNASLDAEGEAALIQAIGRARQAGATIIVVAHRPSAIAALSTLMVLRDGKQIALGPKDEVLQKVLSKPVPKDGRSGGLTAQPGRPPRK
jgi:PrtD family type I secretion system ABC transporter